MEPSSSNKGFFQAQPVLKNQLYDDISIQRTVKRKSLAAGLFTHGHSL